MNKTVALKTATVSGITKTDSIGGNLLNTGTVNHLGKEKPGSAATEQGLALHQHIPIAKQKLCHEQYIQTL